MKKKIIIILLILSFPFYVKATTEDAGFEPLLINNKGVYPYNLEIEVYIPYNSDKPLKVDGKEVVPCGYSIGNGNVYKSILNVPIFFYYSYSINNTHNKEVYAGGKIFYNYSIKEQVWWKKDQEKASSIYLPKDYVCFSANDRPISDNYELGITKFCNKSDGCSDSSTIELTNGSEELENLLQSSITSIINKNDYNDYNDLVSIAFPDSNDYNRSSNKDIGSLEVDETYNYEVDNWPAGENYAINRTYQYKIYDAYINFKNKANIEYKASAPTDMENYIKVSDIINNDSNDLKSYDSNIFFVPLNYPSGELKIEATYTKFGLLDINIDDVTTTARVEVKQNLYDKNGSYKINYRPIDVSKVSINNKAYIDKIARYKNWNDWLKQGGNEYVTQNVNRIKYSYDSYPEGYDYKVSFSGKSDLNSDWNYSDWKNINRNGSSNFLSYNSKIEQKINTTKNYCEIGEFSDDCNIRNN